MFCSRLLVVAALAVGLAGPVWGDVIAIDSFEDSDAGSRLQVDDGYLYATTDSDRDSALAEVIGGERFAELLWQNGLDMGEVRIDFRDSGLFSLSDGADTSALARLSYGDQADLDADVTDGGTNDRFLFEFLTADLEGTLSITVSTTGGAMSFWQGDTPSGLFNSLDQFEVPFADFTDVGQGVSWGNVDEIVIALTGADNGDYVLDGIWAVPEPTTLGLLAMGGLLALRRRRS